MMLLKVIDGLFIGTRYGAWLIALLGIAGSLVLAVANVGAGFSAVLVCAGALLLSIAVTLLLMPKSLLDGFLKNHLQGNQRFVIGAAGLVMAMVLVGGVYFANGGFPDMNLIFG